MTDIVAKDQNSLSPTFVSESMSFPVLPKRKVVKKLVSAQPAQNA